MAEGDTSCNGKCCTYDSSEENRHVSLQGRVEGEGWQPSCVSSSRTVQGCTVEVGSTMIMHSAHHTHMPREHSTFPTPAAQHCARRLPTHSNWPSVLVVTAVYLLLLSHPTFLAASQDLSSPTLLYGVPDVVAAVGQPFSLTIPEDAFSGYVANFEITALGASSLPEWLTFAPDERTLLGLPLRGDEKSWLIQVRAYGEETAASENAEDEENFVECIFQLEVVSKGALTSNKQALAMFDKDTFGLPAKKPQTNRMFNPANHRKTSFCDENAKSTFWAGLVLSANVSAIPVQQRLSILHKFAKFFAVSSEEFSIGKDLSGPVVKASSDVPNARIASSASMVSFPIACNSFDPSVEPYSSILHRLNVCLLECQSEVNYTGHMLTVHQWVITSEKTETSSQRHKSSRQRRQAVQPQVDPQPSTGNADIYFVFTTALTEDFSSQPQSITPTFTPLLTSSSSVQPAFSSIPFLPPGTSSVTVVPVFTSFLQPSVEETETPTFSSVISSDEETVTPTFSFVISSEEETVTPTFSFVISSEEERVTPTFSFVISSEEETVTPTFSFVISSEEETVTPTFSFVISSDEETVTPTFFSSEVPSSRVVPTSVFTLTELPSSSELELSISMPIFIFTSELASPSVVPVSDEPTPVLSSLPSSTPTTSLLVSSLLATPSPVVPSTPVSVSSSTEELFESSSLAIIPSPSPSEEETPSFAVSSMAVESSVDLSSVPVIPPGSPSIQASTVPEETFTVESSDVIVQPTTSTLPPSLTLSAFPTSSSMTLPPSPLPPSSESSIIEETPSFTLLIPSESSSVQPSQPSPSPPAPSVGPTTSLSISSPATTLGEDTSTSVPMPTSLSSTPLPVEPTPSNMSVIVTLAETSLPSSPPSQPVIPFSSGEVEPTVTSVTPSVTSVVAVSSSPVLDIAATSSASLGLTLVTRELLTSVASSLVLPPTTAQPSFSTQVELTTPATSTAFVSSPPVSSIVVPPTTTELVTFPSSTASPSPTPSPSPQPPPNTPPKLVEAVGLLSVQQGQVFTYDIPHSTFMDAEDGLTSNLTLVLLNEFGQPLPNTTWVQLNGMQIEGLPVDSPVNVGTVTDVNFILTAVDSAGDFVVDFVTIRVHPVADTGFNATLTVEGDYTLFRQNLSRQIEIAHLIAEGHSNSLSDIQILTYREGSVAITYTSLTISSYNCSLQRRWEKSLRTPQADTYLYTDTFIAIFDSRQYSLSGQPEFQGFCSLMNATLSPTEEATDVLIPTVISGSGIGFILFLSVIIPGVVVALTLLVIGIIAFGLYRIRRKERSLISSIGEERAFLRRNPVILHGEAQSVGRRKRRNPYHLEDEGVPGSVVSEVPHSPRPPEFESPRGPDSPPPAYQLPPDSYYDKYEAPYDYVETNMYAW